MANLTIDPLKVKLVEAIEAYPMPAEVAITAGQMGKLSTTTGKVNLSLSTTAPNAALTIGMALTGTDRQPAAPTFLRRGIVDVGEALAALAYGATVYLSDTAGTLADAAGTSSKIVGTVIPGFGSTTPDKLLRIDV